MILQLYCILQSESLSDYIHAQVMSKNLYGDFNVQPLLTNAEY